jgi:hypothetical protein
MNNLSITTFVVVFDEKCSKILVSVGQGNRIELFTPLADVHNFDKDIKEKLRQHLGIIVDMEVFLLGIEGGQAEPVAYVSITLNGEVEHQKIETRWIGIGELSKNLIDQQSVDVILKFRDKVRYEKAIAHFTKLSSALEKSREFIEASCNHVGDLWGWDHNLDVKERLGTIGTSLALIALSRFPGRSRDLIEKAVTTLIKIQHPNGGWGTRSIQDSGVPVVHSTAYAILALNCMKRAEDRVVLNKAVSWLKKAQAREGGWGVDEKSKSQLITPTTLALQALHTTGSSSSSELAIKWLIAAQYPDGGWGCYSFKDRPKDTSTASHTGRVLHILLDAGISRNEKIIVQGVNWLLDHQLGNNTWESTAESEYISDNSARLEFKHSGHQWALMGLMKAGETVNLKVLEGLALILEEQDAAGWWRHPLAPGHIPTWATFDNILTLDAFRNNIIDFMVEARKDLMENIFLDLQMGGAQGSIQSTSKKSFSQSVWSSGLFYIFTMIILILTAVFVSSYVSSVALPVILAFILLAFILVVVSVFRQTDKITSENFVSLFSEMIRSIPFINKKKTKP